MRRDRLGRPLDKGQIGLALPRQRRRHAQDDRVDLTQPREIVGRLEPPRVAQPGDGVRPDMADIGAAGIEHIDLAAIDVDAEHGKAAFRRGPQQRQSDIAEADNANPGGVLAEPRAQYVNIDAVFRLLTWHDPTVRNRMSYRNADQAVGLRSACSIAVLRRWWERKTRAIFNQS